MNVVVVSIVYYTQVVGGVGGDLKVSFELVVFEVVVELRTKLGT